MSAFSVIGVALSLVIIIPGPTIATYYGDINVPGAVSVTSGGDGAVPGAANAGDFLYAHEYATLGGISLPPGHGYAVQWVQTRDFTAGVWTDQFHTGRNITLPPDTAIFLGVWFDLRWQPTHIPDYKAGLSLNAGVDWTWGAFHSARTISVNTSESENITSFAVWTPQILKSPNLCVKIESYSYEMIPAVYCYLDYIGIYYLWSGPDPEENETVIPGDESVPFAMPSITGLMGATGFIGMIGVPAASIWFFRRDGGSKIMIGVSALVAFTVCFGFFYASINGG